LYGVFGIAGAVVFRPPDSPVKSLCIQDAGRKTSEKIISAEFREDSSSKPLFNTLFMMFNSRYRGVLFPREL
jgi:hypothetical protein